MIIDYSSLIVIYVFLFYLFVKIPTISKFAHGYIELII